MSVIKHEYVNFLDLLFPNIEDIIMTVLKLPQIRGQERTYLLCSRWSHLMDFHRGGWDKTRWFFSVIVSVYNMTLSYFHPLYMSWMKTVRHSKHIEIFKNIFLVVIRIILCVCVYNMFSKSYCSLWVKKFYASTFSS